LRRRWLIAAVLEGCSTHERHTPSAEPVALWEADRARIFTAAEEAMRLHAVIGVSDERSRLLRGHMGPYAVKIEVPVDVARAEIRCSREGEWSAAAIRREALEGDAAAAADGPLTAAACVTTLKRAIESRLEDPPAP
jgi:hypothetical protein